MPAIRLGGDSQPWPGDGRAPTARLRSRQVEVGGVPTRAVSSAGEGVPAVLLHGWLDNADTWLSVLDRLSVAGRTGIAYDVARKVDADPNQMLPREASMAKLKATELAKKCSLEGMQMMGGYGYSSEYDMERLVRTSLVSTIYGGTSEIQRTIIAKTLGL